LFAAPEPSDSLIVTHDDQGALWVLALAGEADLSTRDVLVRGLASALAMNRGVVAVDVSGLEFCDSWSVDAVLEANSNACSSTMVLVGGHGVVSRVFDLLDPEETLARHD
jgi:anti-anti-sigma regulatory factor